jgi:hypothetical protein
MATATTDSDGKVIFRDIKPGNYVLVIEGKAMARQIETVIVTAEKRTKNSSIIFGIGGHGDRVDKASGGVASHGNSSSADTPNGRSGAGKSAIFNSTNQTGDYRTAGRPGNGKSQGYNVDPGVGVYQNDHANIGNPDSDPRAPGIKVEPERDHDLGNGRAVTVVVDFDLGSAGHFSRSEAYRSDTARKGIRLEFTVPGKVQGSTAFYGEPRNVGITVGARF